VAGGGGACPECGAAVGRREFACNRAMDAACANASFQLQLLEGILLQVLRLTTFFFGLDLTTSFLGHCLTIFLSRV
jgi:hypothetical protein